MLKEKMLNMCVPGYPVMQSTGVQVGASEGQLPSRTAHFDIVYLFLGVDTGHGMPFSF